MGTHNNKQDKVALREEGVDPAAWGSRVRGGEADQVLWIPPGGGEDGYVEFGVEEWRGLVGGEARL